MSAERFNLPGYPAMIASAELVDEHFVGDESRDSFRGALQALAEERMQAIERERCASVSLVTELEQAEEARIVAEAERDRARAERDELLAVLCPIVTEIGALGLRLENLPKVHRSLEAARPFTKKAGT